MLCGTHVMEYNAAHRAWLHSIVASVPTKSAGVEGTHRRSHPVLFSKFVASRTWKSRNQRGAERQKPVKHSRVAKDRPAEADRIVSIDSLQLMANDPEYARGLVEALQ